MGWLCCVWVSGWSCGWMICCSVFVFGRMKVVLFLFCVWFGCDWVVCLNLD